MIKYFSFLILIAGTMAPAAGAVIGAPLSPEDRSTVARAEAYLNQMQSLKSRFSQHSSAGTSAEGTLYLRRPGKLRLDYAPPSKTQVYADGIWLIYVDTELKEVTQVPLGATLAGFLVRKNISLSGKVKVTKVEHGPRSIMLHLVQSSEPEAGTLVLYFNREPYALRSWKVIDARGITTSVNLVGPEINAAIGSKVFHFDASKYDEPIRD